MCTYTFWTCWKWRKCFRYVITRDELWIFFFDPESKRKSLEWHTSDSPCLKKERMSKWEIESIFFFFSKVKVLVIRNSCLKGKQLLNSTILKALND
jgi:hypothetical protein